MIVDLTEPERLALAYVARREIETNRYIAMRWSSRRHCE
jgi:hypothetical protein